MKILNKIEQYSEEWWNQRAGRLTASNASTIQANGKGLETYVYQLLEEKYSHHHDSYQNQAMQNGTELEPQARDIYEIETGNTVKEVGMITEGKYVSCSPDGLVEKDGGLEIKCPTDKIFFKILLNGEKEIDKKYLWQVQMSLMISQRKWWDLAIYNPNFDKSLLVFRQYPKLEMQEKLTLGIEKGKNLIIKLEKQYGQSKNDKDR